MRKTNSSTKYSTIVDAAKVLFWKHGISRITVEEICREASVSKMTFYRLFNNKNQLAEKLLVDFYDSILSQYHEIMRQNTTFDHKMKKVFLWKQELLAEMGNEFIKDIYQTKESSINKILESYTKKSREIFIKDVKEAQENGEIRKELNLEFVVFLINTMSNMTFRSEIRNIYPDPRVAAMEIGNFFLYGLMQ